MKPFKVHLLKETQDRSKKISEMHAALKGYWASDKWDVRKCELPTAIELCKYPS